MSLLRKTDQSLRLKSGAWRAILDLREVPVQCCEPVATKTGSKIVYPQSMTFAKPSITSARTWSFIGLAFFHRGKAKKPTNCFDSFDPKDRAKSSLNSLLPVREFPKGHRVMFHVVRIAV